MQYEISTNGCGEGCHIIWRNDDHSTEGGLFYDADGFVSTGVLGPVQMVTLREIEQSADYPDQAKRWARRAASNQQVAKTIKEQISMSAYMACGARNFISDGRGLQFHVSRGQLMTIKLNGSDLYDIRVYSNRYPHDLVAEAYFIEAGQLSEVVVRLGDR